MLYLYSNTFILLVLLIMITMFATNSYVKESSYLDNLESKLLSVVLAKKVLASRMREFNRSVVQ